MKRAFIRLFGCILSAIGLSMSYDTTFTMLLDGEAAPGVAFAASGDTGIASGSSGSGGSGSSSCDYGYHVSGCTVAIPGAGSGWAASGICDHEGHRMQYFTKFITGWYVAWPNYKGGGVATTRDSAPAGWPYPLLSGAGSNIDIKFSLTVGSGGVNETLAMNGNYVEVGADLNGNSFELCADRNIVCHFGMSGSTSACLSAASSFAGLYYGTCIANVTDNYGGLPSNLEESKRQYGPIYRYGKDAFVKFGCGLASSNGTCASSYKCCYGPTTNVYTVTGCGAYYNYNNNNWACGSITTQRVAQPIVFYQFSGCAEQYYPKAAMAGAAGRYAMDGFANGGPYQKKLDETYNACPGEDIPSHGNGLPSKVFGGTDQMVYDFKWTTCDWCSDMTAIYNSSSFSPSITSMGTVTYLPSATVNTCKASVKGNKDASGTFDIVEPCTY